MFIEGLLSRGSMGVLEQVMSFTEARQGVLVDNISNFDTVGYKVKDLSVDEFFGALNEAIERRDRGGAGSRLEMRATKSLQWDRNGCLRAKAVEIEDNNILFHDQNNRFVEKQMTDMAKNAMLHNIAAELLRGQYNSLQSAIRGKL